MSRPDDPLLPALEAVRQQAGVLTPSAVVAAAADPAFPHYDVLHPQFEWDDAVAAHEYRLQQARQLIATRVYQPEGAVRQIRAYIHVPAPRGEGEYVPAAVLVRQPDRLELARAAVVRALDSARDNLAELDEAVRVLGAPIAAERSRRARQHINAARSELVPEPV